MRSLLRDNLALVVGIALPIGVVAVFVLVNAVPRWLTEPPRHDMLLAYDDYASARRRDYGVDIEVVDGRVRARIVRPDDVDGRVARSRQVPRLFRYDAGAGQVREIDLPLPADAAEVENGAALSLPGLADAGISAKLTAPDGYAYVGQGSASASILGGLFGTSRGRDLVVIEKAGARLSIPLPATSSYRGRVRFIGWIVEP